MAYQMICYKAGEVVGDIIYAAACSKVAVSTYRAINRIACSIAEDHVIDSSDAQVVSENLINCLQYID